jgi:alginate O-acetyltransferase complex protein AlgI
MCLALLVIYKYTGFFTDTFCALFGLENLIPKVALPIGISFYTFQLISYVADVYRGETPPQRSYGKLLLYAALFHQCIAGPIVRYVDVAKEIDRRSVSLDETFSGMLRFTVGLGKKAVLANTCATVADTLLNAEKLGAGQVSSLGVLLGVTAYMLQIYLDFSAYSDMAIGMGRMIGFHFKENFNYPYTADSVTDFWRRWHISLSSFFRDYVYIPLGGNRCAKGRHILNILVVWMLTGFWHGASWNFVLWGLYFALFLLLEKFVFRWQKHGNAFTVHLRRLYTLAVVWFGWFLFRFDDMGLMGHALKSLFGGYQGFNGDNAHYTLKSYLFILLVAMIACTPIIPFFTKKLTAAAEKDGALGGLARAVTNTVAVVAPIALLILSALALVGDSYNPFLYFRF